jgi:hypothetical protein
MVRFLLAAFLFLGSFSASSANFLRGAPSSVTLAETSAFSEQEFQLTKGDRVLKKEKEKEKDPKVPRCQKSNSITVKPVPCSGTAITDGNVWQTISLSENVPDMYESAVWNYAGVEDVTVTHIGIPLQLMNGDIDIYADMHCADFNTPQQYLYLERWNIYTTVQKYVLSLDADTYSNVWLKFNRGVQMRDGMQCRIFLSMASREEAIVRIMRDDTYESYNFGLIEAEPTPLYREV